jgi:hypothetical protein
MIDNSCCIAAQNFCPDFSTGTGKENFNGVAVSSVPGCYKCSDAWFCRMGNGGVATCASAVSVFGFVFVLQKKKKKKVWIFKQALLHANSFR